MDFSQVAHVIPCLCEIFYLVDIMPTPLLEDFLVEVRAFLVI